VLTIGELYIDDAQHGITKVPGRVDFTLDFRSQDESTLSTFNQFLQGLVGDIGKKRGLNIELGHATHAASAKMDESLINSLTNAAIEVGISTIPIPSGGGHDSAVFASQGIPTAMIFVRNDNGSHNADEAMEFDDFAAAFHMMVRWLENYKVD